MTWIPKRTGAAIDLVDPVAHQVDFAAMAWSLANLNRYLGHGEIQVSVGLHILIGLNLCDDEERPYWLLHDGHEERTGDLATPTLHALLVISREMFNDTAGEIVKRSITEMKRRHDLAIHEAAGLPMPSADMRRRIAAIDLRCLATEHRDFHRPSARQWAHELMERPPEPARRLRRWESPDKIAEQLLARFESYLPALRSRAHATLFEGA